MSPTKRRRRRVDWRVLKRIQEKALSPAPPSGVALQRELEQEFGDAAPSLRTTQMLLSEFIPSQPGEWWTFGQGDPEDDALVLPVIAHLYRTHDIHTAFEGPIRTDVAGWIVRVLTAARDMEPANVWEFARRYAVCEAKGWDNRLLTLALSLGVWRGEQQEAQAIKDGLLPADWAYIGPERRLP